VRKQRPGFSVDLQIRAAARALHVKEILRHTSILAYSLRAVSRLERLVAWRTCFQTVSASG
jgi:hypothetical protein